MSTRDTGTYQMLWDCPRCGTEKLLGIDHRHCPSCGSPQDPTRRYYPSEEDKVLAKDHVYAGADKLCPACDAPNSAKAGFCTTCGCPMDDAEEAARRRTQAAAEGADFDEDTADAAASEHEAVRRSMMEARQRAMAGLPPEEEAPAGKKGRGGLFAGLTGMLLLALIIGCCALGAVFLFWKQDAAFTVTGHTWSREIEVERLEEVQRSAWEDEVPRGASDVSCRKEERSTKKVADGETCTTKRKDNGDGTFTEQEECRTKYREEPVYDQKCRYTVTDWVVTRTEEAGGRGTTPAPSWPTVSLRGSGKRLGSEREGDRSESYEVLLKGSDKAEHRCSFPQSTWSSYQEGESLTGQVGVMSGSVDCGSLARP